MWHLILSSYLRQQSVQQSRIYLWQRFWLDYLAPTGLILMKLMPKVVVASTKTPALWLQSMEQQGNESLGRHTSRGGIGDLTETTLKPHQMDPSSERMSGMIIWFPWHSNQPFKTRSFLILNVFRPLMFCSSHFLYFGFWSLLVTKLWKY